MKILIFTASAGNGHNSTANRIKEKVLSLDHDAKIEIIDTYKLYASPLKAWIMEQGYFFICNHAVGLYNHYFKKSEQSTFENRFKSKANKDSYCIMYGMIKKIYEFQPDVIISTYIFNSVALSNLRRFYKIPAKIISMTLDYGISPYWECCADGLDYMFLTNDDMIDRFKKLGYSDHQLIVSGIPVAEKFSHPLPKEDARKLLGLKQNMFTAIIMKASFFPLSNAQIVKALKNVTTPIQVIIINGKDIKIQADMQIKLNHAKLPHEVINLGFSDKIIEFFSASDIVIGKAGGLSTTETINVGLPTLIVDKLPQQEIYNKDYLIENGCAIEITKDTLAPTLNELLSDKTKYENLKNNALKLRSYDTLQKFYNLISSVEKADYSRISFHDSKKQVIKNVNNKRKELIKKNQ